MTDDLTQIKCSHCSAAGNIVETPSEFYCSECGWWGLSPDKLIYDYDSYPAQPKSDGQVLPKRHI